MKNAKNIGDMGEKIVAEYLVNKGMVISHRNFRSRFGEIDIVAENNEIIMFVEVKTRSKNKIAEPSEFVDYVKQKKIIKTALYYMQINRTELQPRFDVAEVLIDESNIFGYAKINYFENAFGVELID